MDDGKKANSLCIISLALTLSAVLLVAVGMIEGRVFDYFDVIPKGFLRNLYTLLTIGYAFLCVFIYIAGQILMIHVREKYPKNVFGKVLMWLYVVGFILVMNGVFSALIECKNAFLNCTTMCS